MLTERSTFGLYLGVVIAAGMLTFLALFNEAASVFPSIDFRRVPSHDVIEFAVLLGFTLVAEFLSIKVLRNGKVVDEITTSTTFSFAILLSLGAPAAIFAQGVSSLACDIGRRKPLVKTLFNLAQYTVSLGAAGGVLALMKAEMGTGAEAVTLSDTPGVVLAALTFFILNNCLTNLAVALAEGEPLVPFLRADLARQGWIDAILLGLAPIVVITATDHLFALPLLGLPMVAVVDGVRRSRENTYLIERLRSRADENQHRALHDALTSLPNSTLFRDRVERALLIGARDLNMAAIMMIDLDGFKGVNDTLGHHTGDLVLQEVAARLNATFRQSDTIARLGGDEFGILLPNVPDVSSVTLLANEFQESLSGHLPVKDVNAALTASIGIALFPIHGTDVDTLMQRADVAMYGTKNARDGQGVAVFGDEKLENSAFTPPSQEQIRPKRLAVIEDLRLSIDNEELIVHYQPKANLQDGQVTGVEALVRWAHPREGLLPPADFICLAEHSGLIGALTAKVLDIVLRQQQAWSLAGVDLTVAVNLSMHSLLDGSFPHSVAALLNKWRLDPGRLEFELTEGVIMADSAKARNVLAELGRLGVGLAIDDFGTGYSSLGYLKQLPVDAIKIDKSFVRDMAGDEDDAVIVRSTIDLGRDLGLQVTAEGVETKEVWNALIDLDCDYAQGFYLCNPVPGEDMVRLLEEGSLGVAPLGEAVLETARR